ncbi:efflux RND transporter periplasmic adaptor subunit [Vulgatibacter incomptus]|uniref:Putative Co/Zn/Cd efflux system membrane fusion protein n=1 Tax=Vulgatibacter incomptus TaxID=1391653 RepID=A0A0K1PFP3_9BACT|nr:efflux RND transporter periplasmic adaptor subunit [Vulgatibacter incomptus]AKU92340.1 putative Co/Zn/Cd efflux system membrane fusion protein [Vulgatibacter incomptus]
MRLSKILASLLVSSALAATLSGCGKADAKATLPAAVTSGARMGVRVVAPTTQLDGQLVKATGSLVPLNEASVSPKVGGTIRELLVDVGSKVRKDQPLARLDSANAAITVEQARAASSVAAAALESATQDFDRAQKLRASGGIAQAGIDKAEAGFKQATASAKQASAGLQAAQKAYSDHTLRAPFDGLVTARMKNLGEYVPVAPPSPIFSLVDTDNLEVVLPVPETVIGAVKPGSVVHGTISPSGEPFDATVRIVGAVVDPRTRTVEVRANLSAKRTDAMRPHAIVEVDFSQGGAITGLFLPAQSVVASGEQKFVWVVAEGAVAKKTVTAESLTPGVVRVVEGLDGNEQVVTDGSLKLADGMQVQVVR